MLRSSIKGSGTINYCKIFCPYLDIIRLSSPTMHGEEQKWVDEAIQTNWVSTVGANINEVKKMILGIKGFLDERNHTRRRSRNSPLSVNYGN